MIAPREALQRLRAGNHRFETGSLERNVLTGPDRRGELVEGQKPFAVILGCSDSRVPAEIVFDQGLGDLFVIRVAGNIVASSQVGSVEFAVEAFGTRLVVVMGHSGCGAVVATVHALRQPAGEPSPNLRSIVDRIRPSVEACLRGGGAGDAPEDLVRRAVRTNIRASADHLRRGSDILQAKVEAGEVVVVGAEYALETGVVTFFDGVPAED